MADHSKTIRTMIEHENHLVNYRLTWLITLQGLLFAALGFAWDKPNAWQIIVVFCTMGIFTAASCLVSLRYTQRAICRLEKWWCKNKPETYDGPEIIGFPLRGVVLYTLPWLVVPTIFILGWAVIFLVTLTRA
jgi:hypothetical protein